MTTLDIFDLVYDFNDKAGLIKAGYDGYYIELAREKETLYETKE